MRKVSCHGNHEEKQGDVSSLCLYVSTSSEEKKEEDEELEVGSEAVPKLVGEETLSLVQ